MTKQKGIIPLAGTIGGINFYYLKGKPIARKSGGGFNGKAIKSKASMQRVRENGSEFGHCSRVNKAFRKSLRPFYEDYTFTFFHSRLMSLFTNLKKLDAVSVRGERKVALGVATETGKRLLQNFDYTPECFPKTVLPFRYDFDWNTYTLRISNFDVKRIKFPKGATHVGLKLGILDFNFDTLKHELHLSSVLMLDASFNGAIVNLQVNGLAVINDTGLAVFGVRFYQEVDGDMYILNGSDGVGFGVVNVFGN